MKVLAIDPGYGRVGIAIMDNSEGKDQLLYSTCLETIQTEDFNDRLLTVGTAIEKLLVDYRPDCVAIETLFFNKNIKTAIGVAEARGAIVYLAKKANCVVYEFGPQEIKVAVTGYGSSDKEAVFSMLKHLVGNLPQKALDDEYDAIAVGLTCLAQHGRSR
ncbi:MAG: crossover junction endodeoxyribonuclease RuvC [Candidatus Paceibacterota bacterium]